MKFAPSGQRPCHRRLRAPARKSLAGLVALSLGSWSPPSAAATPTTLAGLSPRQVLGVSVSAMRVARSVTRISHEFVLARSVTATTLSTGAAALQHVDVLGHRGEIVLVRGVAYVKLDPTLVVDEFHSLVPGVANKWVSFTRRSKYFAGLTTGLTFSSLLNEVPPTGALAMSRPTTLRGVPVVAVTGTAVTTNLKASATLFIATSPPFLPVQETVTAQSSGVPVSAVTEFKNWSSVPVIVAPRIFTPSGKLRLP